MVGSWAAVAICTGPECCEGSHGGATAPHNSFCPNAVLSSDRRRAELNTTHGIVPAVGSMYRDTRIRLTNQIEKVKLNLVHTSDPESQLRHIFAFRITKRKHSYLRNFLL